MYAAASNHGGACWPPGNPYHEVQQRLLLGFDCPNALETMMLIRVLCQLLVDGEMLQLSTSTYSTLIMTGSMWVVDAADETKPMHTFTGPNAAKQHTLAVGESWQWVRFGVGWAVGLLRCFMIRTLQLDMGFTFGAASCLFRKNRLLRPAGRLP